MELTIPFRMRSNDGAVRVTYTVNEDPQRWGNPLLSLSDQRSAVRPQWGTPPPSRSAEDQRSAVPPSRSEEGLPDVGKGFPVCHAMVAFAGEGYASVMGWIQILRFHGAANGVLVDQPPQLEGTDMPYVYFGPCPSLFDNPFTTQRGVHWTAEAFLVISPDAVMTRVVQPVCGFRWGYSTEGELTLALPLAEIEPAAWLDACTVLRERYPSWTFLETWAS